MMRFRLLRPIVAVALALVAWVAPARAQRSVSGVVFDSLITRAPLDGAQVVLDGVEGAATTDRRGRFRIDGLAPGRYRATFFHPSLDALSLSAPMFALEVGEGDVRDLRLATPSFATTARALCGVELDSTTSILLARIRDAEAGRPLPGAFGQISWWEVALGAGGAAQRESRRLVARADSTGSITMCGVPNDIELSISARLGDQSTGDVVLPRGMASVAVQELRISLTDSAARVVDDATPAIDAVAPARGGSARLRLRVRSASGSAISGATVSVRGQSVGGITDDSGSLTLVGVPAGSQTIDVRAIGRAPERQVLALPPSIETVLDVRMSDVATELPEYAVRGLRGSVEIEAFERRRRAGNGRFLDADDLDKLGRRANGLANLPGVRVPMNMQVPTGGMGINSNAFPMVYLRSADGELCTPTMFVDGAPRFRFDGVELHAVLQLAQRVEIYNRSMSVPPEFSNAFSRCGVIAIWTT